MANITELSPIWRTLPYDLIQEILEHSTDHVIASCNHTDDLSYSGYFDPEFTGQVCQHWQAFGQDSLFRSQRLRFERHF
ncbi:hypothetical protein SMACR_04524 [Sordaria macrospora]|uniref:WGS project CABT00000000 data, contig 2.20 n=2 Tax=Sordaria macrospora TaxID=5147 RepID=F7W1Q0_SORMK|nr:uncharacterized protein SMAC_04524 [Sordaria macrospora k-hell]KAA8630756.1 hypothetical protein SMACR_04524 [Sordaria macrospora]WPJ62743.1 hypothetical protein SMAC4_04524 [Sordaria macrospora]CCC11535.1 unnamed protein product [Sordaria macrospora k-hell]